MLLTNADKIFYFNNINSRRALVAFVSGYCYYAWSCLIMKDFAMKKSFIV
jgi:hypothetical protein